MSNKKEEIQVGDIFFSDLYDMKIIITFTKYNLFWGLWETGQSFSSWDYNQLKKFKYIGKSQENLIGLFEVKNG